MTQLHELSESQLYSPSQSKQKTTIPTLNRNGTVATKDSEKANMLNQYFSECFSKAQPPLADSDYDRIHVTGDCPLDFLCTENEVLCMLASLDTSKANGPDGISARMLKATAVSIVPSLTKILNLSIETGKFPELWKHSLVVPIPKANDHKSPSNYRPISLLSVISKLLERHIHLLVTRHLSDSHPLANTQWGFQPGKSTTSALLATTYDWFRELEVGRDVCSVFLDLRKAFDSVPHLVLMSKLHQLNLSPFICRWICSYLTNRDQRVVIGGVSSESTPVISGVPQGSVLGPLLFLIYIDDVTAMPLSEGSNLVLYADDMLLYRRIAGPDDYTMLQNDLNSINAWVVQNHLHFNATKCKFMVISRKRGYHHQPVLFLETTPLEKVDSFRYLGLLISSDLSWSGHIETICSKARQLLGLLYRRLYHHADPQALFQLYLSLIRPHLEYGCPVWDPYLLKDRKILENVQKFGLRICSKQWDLGYEELLTNFNMPTLADRRLQLKLCTMYKIIHGLTYFPSVFVPRNTRTHIDSPLFIQPFARTNSYLYSFIPHSISLWNSLPSNITTACSVSVFRTLLTRSL